LEYEQNFEFEQILKMLKVEKCSKLKKNQIF
jgi:hypothetical protein